MTTTVQPSAGPLSGPCYYRSFISYDIPFRPDNLVEFADTAGLRSFYAAYRDAAGRVVRFEKLRLVRMDKEPRRFEVSAPEEDGNTVYFAVVRDPASRQTKLGKQLDYRETEPLDEFFAGKVDDGGRTYLATEFRKEIAFSEAYDYWPNGHLRQRTMTGPDQPPGVEHYDPEGQRIADAMPESASLPSGNGQEPDTGSPKGQLTAPVKGSFDLNAVQTAIRQFGFDGWLLYDFRGLNVLARRVIGLAADAMLSRRWFYFVPAQRVRRRSLSTASNRTPWMHCQETVTPICAGRSLKRAYRPSFAAPAAWRWSMCRATPTLMSRASMPAPSNWCAPSASRWCRRATWCSCSRRAGTTSSGRCTWRQPSTRAPPMRLPSPSSPSACAASGRCARPTCSSCILDHFAAHGLVTDHPPICAVGPHSGDPHYEPGPAPTRRSTRAISCSSTCGPSCDRPRAVYSDLTWTAVRRQRGAGESMQKIFRSWPRRAMPPSRGCAMPSLPGQPLQGWEVDQAARDVIDQAGYGQYFCHRTGHSIGQETHGNGANMDNLETREERRVLPRTCFSVEPGIYLPEFGVRSEVDVFIDAQNNVHVTGGTPQTAVVPLLAAY